MARALPALIGSLLLVSASALPAQTLRGSRVAMQRQHSVAREQDYTFLRTPAQVRKFAELGLLERVRGNADYELERVSYPYARPALKLFVERLGRQFHAACGEKLVVTSLTRPLSEQPRNASDLSVHPAGMAVDLRISRRASCQRWLERTLLQLEDSHLLDVTRERRPPHYHVAVFPEAYLAHVRRIERTGSGVRVAKAEKATSPTPAPPAAAVAGPSAESSTVAGVDQYEVNRGDSLWTIARRYHTTVEELKELNGLQTSRIAAGQVISVPGSGNLP